MTTLIKIFRFLKDKISKFYKRKIKKDRFLVELNQWYIDKGDDTLRYDYPLTTDSIVMDVGGYKGEFAEKISKKFNCKVFIFEPVTKFLKTLNEKFKDNPKIDIVPCGLGGSNKSLQVSILDDASSAFKPNKSEVEEIKIKDVLTFFAEEEIERVDLLKINIEGGEYELLKRILEKGLQKNIANFQIQFHDFFHDAKDMRAQIRAELEKTHSLTYDYYFVWENWKLREDDNS